MATGNIKIATRDTARVVAADFLISVKKRICRVCEISPEAYDETHYDLAEEWFRYHNYLEYTARVFMLSATYHRWWKQQVAQHEFEFLLFIEGKDISGSRRKDALRRAIISMNIHPSAEIRRVMHAEGTAVLKANPDLWRIKIYRHG